MKRILTILFFGGILFQGRVLAQVQALSIADSLVSCGKLTVTFQDVSTGNPTSCSWDFGDGTSPIQNCGTLTHTYTAPGVYNVVHSVSDGTNTSTESILIRVYRGPQAEFVSFDLSGCSPHCATFTNQTIVGESAISQVVWDYQDPSPTTNYNGSHCYNNPGSYRVSLFVRDINGCESKIVKDNYIAVRPRPRVTLTANPAFSCNAPWNVVLTATITSPTTPDYTYKFFVLGTGTPRVVGPTSATSATISNIYPNGIYNAYVEVEDANGCKDTSFFRIEITDLVAGFRPANDSGCVGVPIQFCDTSNFASSWDWDWGDGSAHSTVKCPNKSYATPGCYDVTLIIRYNTCRDTITKINVICIFPPPNFTFSANQTYNCTAPFNVNFTAVPSSGIITNYAWDFGDGSPTVNTTGPTSSHTYTTATSFTVKVTATSNQGCSVTKTLTNYIKIKDVTARFTTSIDSGCTPLSVRFTNTSIGQAPLSYYWIFGDGANDNVASPTHVFSITGNYKPILIVTNGSGCKDTFVFPRIIKVGSPIRPSFTANPLIQCIDQPVIFTNTTNVAGINPPPLFTWFFDLPKSNAAAGPPGPFTPTKTKTYSDTGCYDIRLRITSQGCIADTTLTQYVCIVLPKADFDFVANCGNALIDTFKSKSQGADLYSWDFGSGPSPFSPSDSIHIHQFSPAGTYSVLHIVKNNATGCVDSLRKTVNVGVSTIGFTADTLSGCRSLTVHFRDTSVYSNTWRWNFGDTASSTNTSSSKNPTHIFTRSGSYTVTLVINPGGDCPDTLRKVAYITVYGITVGFEAIPAFGCVPLNPTFRDTSASYMGTINSWLWTFGDPTTGSFDTSIVQNPNHTYNNLGDYTARLRATDTRGCSATVTRPVHAAKTNADFSSDTAVCPGDLVTFTNLSTNSNVSYWNFGDPSSSSNLSTDIDPTHVFTNMGIYTITLIAVNDTFGCSDTIRRNINVSQPYVNFYDTSGFAPCPPFPVRFFNTSALRPGYKFIWDFHDQPNPIDSITFDPIHVFFYPGDYDVSLTLTDSIGGCTVTRTYEDRIKIRGPIGNFTASTDSGCTPLTVCISGNLQNTFSLVVDMGNGVVLPYDNLTGHQVAPNVCYTYDSSGTFFPTYILRDSLNCTVAYPVDTITVGSFPYPNLESDTTVCEGNYVQFNLTPGDRYLWRSKPTPHYLSCIDCADPISSSPDTVTYYVTVTSGVGCVARDTITINVDPLPSLSPGIDFRICPGDTLQLNAGNGVATAVWSPPLFMEDSNKVNPKVWPSDTMQYRVTAFNKTGCSISKVVNVYPIQNVTGTVSPRDTLVCEGEAVGFRAQVLNASINDTSIVWSPSKYLNATGIFDPIMRAPAGNYTYFVSISSAGCTPYKDSVHVLISPYPDLQAGDNVTVTEGTTVNLWASSGSNVVYTWTPSIDSLSCTLCRRPSFAPRVSQYVYVDVTNKYGCVARDSVYINVVACNDSAVFVPNTFTPNSDNRNDVLYVRGVGISQLNFFRIFDRWGQLVWETSDIGQGWDGSIRGTIGNTATFVYTLQAICTNGQLIEKQGNVTLIR
ncbi:MAG: PKD domain-containing protein [Bacteroidetes bacterium]|nr:PKD domain-containing protein [Bacteroidota bacterium]